MPARLLAGQIKNQKEKTFYELHSIARTCLENRDVDEQDFNVNK